MISGGTGKVPNLLPFRNSPVLPDIESLLVQLENDEPSISFLDPCWMQERDRLLVIGVKVRFISIRKRLVHRQEK